MTEYRIFNVYCEESFHLEIDGISAMASRLFDARLHKAPGEHGEEVA